MIARTEKRRGSRPLSLRDWPFGSRGRRLFLEAVLLEVPPAAGWTKSDLERAAAVERGGADRLIDGAAALGLLVPRDGRWDRGQTPPDLAGPLATLVRLSRELPEASIEPQPRRPYVRR